MRKSFAQRKIRKEHRSRETLKSTKHASLIGIYSSPDQLADNIRSLNKLHYLPYVIKSQDGKSRLFVGTFVTKEGVEKQYHDLKASGIQSQVVER
jgi:hypothetical protein